MVTNSPMADRAEDLSGSGLSDLAVILPLIPPIDQELLAHTLLSMSLQDGFALDLLVITDKVELERIQNIVSSRPFLQEPAITWIFESEETAERPKRFHDWLQLSSSPFVSLIEAGDVLYHKAYGNSCEALSLSSKVICIGTFRIAHAEMHETGIYITGKKSLPAPDESILSGTGSSVIPTAAILLNRPLALELESLNFEFTMETLHERFIKTCLSQPHPAYEMSGVPVAERRIIARPATSQG